MISYLKSKEKGSLLSGKYIKKHRTEYIEEYQRIIDSSLRGYNMFISRIEVNWICYFKDLF